MGLILNRLLKIYHMWRAQIAKSNLPVSLSCHLKHLSAVASNLPTDPHLICEQRTLQTAECSPLNGKSEVCVTSCREKEARKSTLPLVWTWAPRLGNTHTHQPCIPVTQTHEWPRNTSGLVVFFHQLTMNIPKTLKSPLPHLLSPQVSLFPVWGSHHSGILPPSNQLCEVCFMVWLCIICWIPTAKMPSGQKSPYTSLLLPSFPEGSTLQKDCKSWSGWMAIIVFFLF